MTVDSYVTRFYVFFSVYGVFQIRWWSKMKFYGIKYGNMQSLGLHY